MKAFVAIAMLLLCVPGLASAQAAPAPANQTARLPSVTLPPELDRVLRDYERDWRAGDAAALVRLFTEDGFAASRSGWRRGRDEIMQQYGGAGGDLRLRAHAWYTDGDAGYIVGAFGYAETAAERDAGKFLLALRRGPDGRWLIAADLDSANSGG